jgi:hypothetical protein
LIAQRYSPYLKQFYEKTKTRRGTGKAIIALARKLLGIIYRTLKNNWVFQDFPNFVLSEKCRNESDRPLALHDHVPERSSPSRVCFAAPNPRVLDCGGPFRRFSLRRERGPNARTLFAARYRLPLVRAYYKDVHDIPYVTCSEENFTSLLGPGISYSSPNRKFTPTE